MKELIRVVHVDDNPDALAYLKNRLSARKDIKYLGGFTSATDALTFLESNPVDILFLDVEMPGQDGFWLAGKLRGISLDIVFVTGNAGYAVDAFTVCALDFILKPVDDERIEGVFERYYLRRDKDQQQAVLQEQLKELFTEYLPAAGVPTRIFISEVGRITVVPLKDVLYFAAVEGYTNIYMADGQKYISSRRLTTYTDSLVKCRDFVRIHRSYLVNKDYVDYIPRDGASHKYSLVMKNGDELPVSYSKREEIFDKLVM